MYDSSLRDRAELIIALIEETMKLELELEDIPEVDQPQNVDVFLELPDLDEGYDYDMVDYYMVDYYMVDLDKHALFWIEEYDATWMADIIGGIEDESQLCEHTYLHLIRQRCGLFE